MIKTIYEIIYNPSGECACGNSPCVRTAIRYWNPQITFIKKLGKRIWTDSFRTWTAGKLQWKGVIKGKKRICDACYYEAIGRISQANLDVWHEGYGE